MLNFKVRACVVSFFFPFFSRPKHNSCFSCFRVQTFQCFLLFFRGEDCPSVLFLCCTCVVRTKEHFVRTVRTQSRLWWLDWLGLVAINCHYLTSLTIILDLSATLHITSRGGVSAGQKYAYIICILCTVYSMI